MFKKNLTIQLLKNKIHILQHKINYFDQEELAKKIKFARQNFFENVNKPGRWLPYFLFLKKERENAMINSLLDKEGKETFNQKKLKK